MNETHWLLCGTHSTILPIFLSKTLTLGNTKLTRFHQGISKHIFFQQEENKEKEKERERNIDSLAPSLCLTYTHRKKKKKKKTVLLLGSNHVDVSFFLVVACSTSNESRMQHIWEEHWQNTPVEVKWNHLTTILTILPMFLLKPFHDYFFHLTSI